MQGILAFIGAFILSMVLGPINSFVIGGIGLMAFIAAPRMVGGIFGGNTMGTYLAYVFTFILAVIGASNIIGFMLTPTLGQMGGMIVHMVFFFAMVFMVERPLFFKMIQPKL